MIKNYVYRMTHDNGFAPNPSGDFCTLCGCRATTVEKWVEIGSWIIGIGGNNTRKKGKVIFAMHVTDIQSVRDFIKCSPSKGKYLVEKIEKFLDSRVLISNEFYYLGNRAIDPPDNLLHIVPKGRGTKRLSTNDAHQLANFLESCFGRGKTGEPNNPDQ